MDIVRKIEKLSDEELEQFVIERIDKLEKEQTEKEVSDTIGYLLDCGNTNLNLLESIDELVVSKFDGYIPRGTRIVYGMIVNGYTGFATNGGNYYYLDDDSYILDFCKYLRTQDVCDQFELFDCVLDFCNDYFGVIETIKREDMNKLIYKNKEEFYEPINEHVLSMFKKKGNNQCSELSVVAQNILAFLGYDISVIIGNHQIDGEKPVAHAYNMVNFKHSITNEDVSVILDMSASVYVLDINHNMIGLAPYVHYLDKPKDQAYNDMLLTENKEIECPNYSYMLCSQEKVWKFAEDRYRHYSLNITSEDNTLSIQKTYKKE